MDFNDYPSQRSISWKPIAIGGGVLVLIVGIVVVVVALRKDNEAFVAPQRPERVEMREQALGIVSVDACALLAPGEEVDNCLWMAATDALDVNICIGIGDETLRDSCTDTVAQKMAFAEKDPGLCDEIRDIDRASRCRSILAAPITSANCQERLSQEACADLAVVEQAVAAGDATLCMDIVDEFKREECVDDASAAGELITEDPDNDGLTNADETRYGTDPQNPDSDGDGYQDGQEVSGGYDPLGPGRL